MRMKNIKYYEYNIKYIKNSTLLAKIKLSLIQDRVNDTMVSMRMRLCV